MRPILGLSHKPTLCLSICVWVLSGAFPNLRIEKDDTSCGKFLESVYIQRRAFPDFMKFPKTDFSSVQRGLVPY
jgi:hypothetical protein